MKIKTSFLSIIMAVLTVAFLSSMASASQHCLVLGNSGPVNITLDGDGTIHGTVVNSGNTIVGIYRAPFAAFSLGYPDAATRPVHHLWDVGSMTGSGVARNANGVVDKWTYNLTNCGVDTVVDDDVDAATGE